MNATDKIRAALERQQAARRSTAPPQAETAEPEPQSTAGVKDTAAYSVSGVGASNGKHGSVTEKETVSEGETRPQHAKQAPGAASSPFSGSVRPLFPKAPQPEPAVDRNLFEPAAAPSEPVERILPLVGMNDRDRSALNVRDAAASVSAPPKSKPASKPPSTPSLAAPPAKASPAKTSPPKAPSASVPPASAPVASPRAASAPAAAEPIEDSLATARQPRVLYAIAGILVLVAAGLGFYFLRGSASKGKGSLTPENTVSFAVESNTNGLITLHWNAQSKPITAAREAKLTILEDQKAPRTVALNPAQLSMGRLYYESAAQRVEFHLEITETTGAVVAQSVAAQGSAPVQTAQDNEKQQERQPDKPSPMPADDNSQKPAADAGAQPVEEKPAPAPVRAFVPPPVRQQTPGEGRLILLEPAPDMHAGTTPSLPSAPLAGARVNVIPPPEAKPTPQTPAARPASRITVGGAVQQAMLIRTVKPLYSQVAKDARVEGTVRFSALIGKSGKVENLKVVGGPLILQASAAAAVKQWVYRPTLLDGQPVEVQTEIEIRFALH